MFTATAIMYIIKWHQWFEQAKKKISWTFERIFKVATRLGHEATATNFYE